MVKKSWGPTAAGKLFTQTPDWRVSLDGRQFSLVVKGNSLGGDIEQLAEMSVQPGLFWSTVRLPGRDGQQSILDGIPNRAAKSLSRAIATKIEQLRDFKSSVERISNWATQTVNETKAQLRSKGWITGEFIQRQIQRKPIGLDRLLSVPDIEKFIEGEPAEHKDAIALSQRDLQEFFANINERHLAKQLTDFREFFDTVERSPLTEEQAKAVVCFDNRVLLVASAGSGKTSTMVAKAGYALKNGYVTPEKMLLLAFNNKAAKELDERIKGRLAELGPSVHKVVAKTFHAFGLDVIGRSTGKRPSIAPWIETEKDLEYLLQIADDLKDTNSDFRVGWDLFRIVFGQDLPEFGQEEASPDAWDSNTKRQGFKTLNDEVVKSRGEQMLANWFFYNGVKYLYEPEYEVDTADASHRQYRPDFYFPDANAFLEHWALNEKGEPPPEFRDYKEGMAWKKQLHKQHGTTLLETTAADLWSGKAFRYLERELAKRGVVLNPNPDRPVPGKKPLENPRLARTFRSFLTHVKSNRLSMAELKTRLDAGVAGGFQFRHRLFLTLFELIWEEWESRLGERYIDYEDMLNMAVDCIETGQWTSPYDLVMVDEFQDASEARARLVAALVNAPDRNLFAVGDDWQSINRFAGADLGVMTNFEQRFGRSVTLRLETTFRCPQALCDITSAFIQKNPKQLRKAVRSAQPAVHSPVSIFRVDGEGQVRDAIMRRLQEISDAILPGCRQDVLVLGRYNKDRVFLPTEYDRERIELGFATVHSSKGTESDHVILPRMVSDTLGFPSRVADDPVLQLAMPGGDSYAYAEERRLFYVALTRARSTVTLVTIAHKESPFVWELLGEHPIEVQDVDGFIRAEELCPACGQGFLVQRNGAYGPFLGCSGFPSCTYIHRPKKERVAPPRRLRRK